MTILYLIIKQPNNPKIHIIMAIKIIGASYGVTTKGADVTAIVQKMVNNGNDDVAVTNQALGDDPAPGIKKQFGVVYQLPNGKVQARCAIEGQTIDLV